MSYSLVFAPCVNCGAVFGFNPERVPSFRMSVDGKREDPTQPRQPVCRSCWERRQAYRREHGLPVETLLPGAYDAVSEIEEGYDDYGDA
jgi:hypothetical protein